MTRFHYCGLFIPIAATIALASLLSAQQPGEGSVQTVYTMRGEYEIQPDGTGYVLRRLAKDGSVYQTIPITRSSGLNRQNVYIDAGSGIYTVLPDGRLEEKVNYDSATPAPAAPPVPATPPTDVQVSARVVDYQGRSGAIVTRSDTSGQHSYLSLTGEPDRIQLDAVRGSSTLFTLAAREDVYLIIDGNEVTLTDSQSREITFKEALTPAAGMAPPAPASATPATSGADSVQVKFDGRSGRIVNVAGSTRGNLFMDGEPGAIAVLDPVRGSASFFTPVGRNDINVIVDSRGDMTVTDSGGRTVSLKELRDIGTGSVAAVPADAPASTSAGQAGAASPLPASAGGAYAGPMSATLECPGQPIPQNGEQVFKGLPDVDLHLVYDESVWEAQLVPDGQTQKLILRNKKPGTQKKCTVHWSVGK